jgi:hypothetical protein
MYTARTPSAYRPSKIIAAQLGRLHDRAPTGQAMGEHDPNTQQQDRSG